MANDDDPTLGDFSGSGHGNSISPGSSAGRDGCSDGRTAELENRCQRQKEKIERLEDELETYKQPPQYVATVEEVTEAGEAIIRQHGSNQEAVSDLPESLVEELEPPQRVAVNQNLSIIDTLPAATDSRTQSMHVDESPDCTYDDIGGITEAVENVRETVETPITNPDVFDSVGIDPPSGVLLHGPPGTGKTLLARAVANHTDATFIKLAASELVNKFIGEGPKLVRELFETAREEEPAVIFIDEIDAIASERSPEATSGEGAVQRTLIQLLSELDGFDTRGDVQVIAATNRLDVLDDAVVRPGRFDRLVEVPSPDAAGRKEILEIHSEDMNLSDDVSLPAMAELLDGATGADVEAVCTEAGMYAIRDDRTEVTEADFANGIQTVLGQEDADDGQSETPGLGSKPTTGKGFY